VKKQQGILQEKNSRLFPITILIILIFITQAIFTQEIKDIHALIQEGDHLYDQRRELANAYNAIEKYRQALTINPQCYEALWKTAKTTFFLAEMLTDKEQKKEIVTLGVECAKKAVEINPNDVAGHFWLGVCYTKVGEVKGVLKALFLISPIKREMRIVIAKNRQYEAGGAYTVLGRVYSQVPGILGGSNEKARKFYEIAYRIAPKNSLNLLFMAETYWDLEEKEKAIHTLEELLSMTPEPQWLPETEKNQRAGKELLAKYRQTR